MKRLLLAATLLAALAGTAYADTVQVDDSFEKANKWLKDKNLTLTGSPNGQRDDNAAFSQDAIVFYGEGVGNPEAKTPAQREMMAKRAAVVMAQRAVAEYLEGFAIVGDTLVKDCMVQSDALRQSVSAFVKGVQVIFQDYSKEKDTAIAIVKIGLHGPKGYGSLIYGKMMADPQLKKSLTEIDGKQAPQFTPPATPPTEEPAKAETPKAETPKAETPKAETPKAETPKAETPKAEAPKAEAPKAETPKAETPKVEPAPEQFDGLIIDATEQNFQPALINRIFSTKGEILYDPSKVSQKVLVEQGCGEYTNSVDKAKAALGSRGVKNPLIVKASGAATRSDLQVPDDVAATIFTANRQGDFLAGAKVAFVLK